MDQKAAEGATTNYGFASAVVYQPAVKQDRPRFIIQDQNIHQAADYMIPVDFLRTKRINSFQKLRFLLFLQQHPHFKGSAQEYAHYLHLGSELLLTDIIHELYKVGLLMNRNNCWQLTDEAGVTEDLQRLAQAFENPLTRQEILAQLRSPRIAQYFNYMPE